MKYFSYDVNGRGITFHATEEEAKAACQKTLDEEAMEAVDGWSQEFMDNPCCWGEVREVATEVPCAPDPHHDPSLEIIDFKLLTP
jgi:hypothetical protein